MKELKPTMMKLKTEMWLSENKECFLDNELGSIQEKTDDEQVISPDFGILNNDLILYLSNIYVTLFSSQKCAF